MSAIVLALAGLCLTARLPDQRHSIVAAVDVSDSVDGTGREVAARYVKELARSIGPEDELAVLTFAADTRIVSARASSENLDDDLPLPPNRSATDIARAIDTAMAVFSPNTQRRLLLLTDGHETRGVARDQIARLRAANVPIDALVPPNSARADIALDKLIVPSVLSEDQTVPMQAVPYGRTPQIGKAHPALQEEVIYLEDAAQSLAGLAESALRKHGRGIVEQQLLVSRIADIAIDLLALSTTLARTTRIIEKRGLEKAQNEVSMTYTFYSDARRRIRSNLRASTGRNNDDSIQHVAEAMLATGGYKNDFLK